MGIIHTARRHIKDEIVRKLREEILEERKRSNINATLNLRDDAQVNLNAIYQFENHFTHWINIFTLTNKLNVFK